MGDYICINYNDGISDDSYSEGRKLKVLKLTKDHIYLRETGEIQKKDKKSKKTEEKEEVKYNYLQLLKELVANKYKSYKWNISKDDIKPKEMFKKQKGNSSDRADVAKYCLQDCASCNRLYEKLKVQVNNMGMSNVCSVPYSYLFLRGQGVKGHSLVARTCQQLGYLIPTVRKTLDYENRRNKLYKYCVDQFKEKYGLRNITPEKENVLRLKKACANAIKALENESEFIMALTKFYKNRDLRIKLKHKELEEKVFQDGYEGAHVIPPKPKLHFDPIVVFDYSSLYPKSAIHKNISHETIVKDPKYDNLPGFHYYKVEYRNNDGTIQTCKYARKNSTFSMGIIPTILLKLLEARETTKNLMDNEKVPFIKQLLNGLQLAYKVTANSLYGLLGAPTSPLYYKELAASITATGRDMLKYAIKIVLKHFPDAEIIYGDTDSIFVKFKLVGPDGKKLEGQAAIIEAMRIGKIMETILNDEYTMPYPHKIVLEKVMGPLAILTKKRYVGNLYGDFKNPDKFYLKSMGIALKRRDNAPIVKIMCGRVIHYLINERSIDKAIEYINKTQTDIDNGLYGLDKFVITKTLKDTYANPESQAHYQLAERMGRRDEGSRPQVNDRLPYCYVETDAKKINAERYKKWKKDISELPKEQRLKAIKAYEEKNKKKTKQQLKDSILQGDRIEHIDYIREHKLKIDTVFYIMNQIMIPICQFLDLVIEKPEDIFVSFIKKAQNKAKGIETQSIMKWVSPNNKKKAYTLKKDKTEDEEKYAKKRKTKIDLKALVRRKIKKN